MRRVRGKVVGGKVVLEEPLPEGAEVVVLVHDAGEEELDATDAEWDELVGGIAQLPRGQVVSVEDLLAELRTRRH